MDMQYGYVLLGVFLVIVHVLTMLVAIFGTANYIFGKVPEYVVWLVLAGSITIVLTVYSVNVFISFIISVVVSAGYINVILKN